jgi:hypothetical protein
MKYYQLHAQLDGQLDVIFGSYIKQDCKDELDCERESLKDQGYKGFKIVAIEVEDTPDLDVYDGQIVTRKQYICTQMPAFNFELDADELIDKGLEDGFITDLGNDHYLINSDY